MTAPVALVHDYLTQRGGAERVALVLAEAFPDAELYTSLFDPSNTYPEFSDIGVHSSPLNRFALLRRRHRLAFPFLAPTFAKTRVDAKVTICSSSGWAHGVKSSGRKIVYCYTPARWLYSPELYFGIQRASDSPDRSASLREVVSSIAIRTSGNTLRRWDRRAALGADRYLTTSRYVQTSILNTYGIEAELLPPPSTLDPTGPEGPIVGLDPGYFLCVSRLLPYKNVAAIVDAFKQRPNRRLVVVGAGPDFPYLKSRSGTNTSFIQNVSDAELRWLYRHADALVAAAFEDYGLTPLEAGSFGTPSIVLRAGGFLDTIIPDLTGLFFNQPDARSINSAVDVHESRTWSPDDIRDHVKRYSKESFLTRVREIVAEETEALGLARQTQACP
jgi:glycosyltransferase involved in cell wall biosynthesis